MGIFKRSLTRELGKNTGKWLSNKIFGDGHATPHKIIHSNAQSIKQVERKQAAEYRKKEEEKAREREKWERERKEFHRELEETKRNRSKEENEEEVMFHQNYLEVIQSIHGLHIEEPVSWTTLAAVARVKLEEGGLSKEETDECNLIVECDDRLGWDEEGDYWLKAIEYINPFEELMNYGSDFRLEKVNGCVTVDFLARDETIVPIGEKMLSANGLKIVEKPFTKSRFNEVYQDFVCSSVLRIAKDIFQVLPGLSVDTVLVNVLTMSINSATGKEEEQVLLSVKIPRATLDGINFINVDPSDCMANFSHNMAFSIRNGFSPVSRLSPEGNSGSASRLEDFDFERFKIVVEEMRSEKGNQVVQDFLNFLKPYARLQGGKYFYAKSSAQIDLNEADYIFEKIYASGCVEREVEGEEGGILQIKNQNMFDEMVSRL